MPAFPCCACSGGGWTNCNRTTCGGWGYSWYSALDVSVDEDSGRLLSPDGGSGSVNSTLSEEVPIASRGAGRRRI